MNTTIRQPTEHETVAAEALGISALQHLAGDDDLMMRFCALSGILANDIRSAAAQPGFLAGVLEFYLSHEPDLLAWCSAAQIDPQTVMNAHNVLAPNEWDAST